MSRSISETKDMLQRVRQTRKITNALYLLSSARLANDKSLTPYRAVYSETLKEIISAVLKPGKEKLKDSPFIFHKNAEKPLYLIIAGDRGLCGRYNLDIFELARKIIPEKSAKKEVTVYGFGKIFRSRGKRVKVMPDRVIDGSASHPETELCTKITNELLEMFLSGKIDEINVICSPFDNGKIKPVCRRILPLKFEDFEEYFDKNREVDFVPDKNSVFERAVQMYIDDCIYSLLILSAISENTARMTAMKESTDRADERAEELERSMNELRQLEITNELTEISAAAQAEKNEQ